MLWKEVVDKIHVVSPLMASLLRRGHVLCAAPDSITVGFDNQFYFEAVSDRLSNLSEISKKAFGKDIRWEVEKL